MTVHRIIANIATDRPDDAKPFYGDILGLEIAMDHGWILTFAGASDPQGGPSPQGGPRPQVSFACEGGSGAPVPDLSIEVDDLDEVHRRMVAAGVAVEYGPAMEPWGVRRFFARDPFGRLVNILAHV